MGKLILLIDDDLDELDVFRDALHAIDRTITCIQSKNLTEALEYLLFHTPDYVFIDFNMPIENGLECVASLKKLNKLDGTKIVLYSNHIDKEMQNEAMSLGAHYCLRKPGMISSLSQKLKLIFANGQAL